MGTSASGQVTGTDLVRLADGTPLSRLNDGNGVRVDGASDDLRFTLHDGSQINVNLSNLLRFNMPLAQLNDGHGVRLGTIRITNHAGASADIDLSAATTVQDVITAINGSGLSVTASLSGSKFNITDGSTGTKNLQIQDVSGNAAADLGIVASVTGNAIIGSSVYSVDSIGDVVRAIQYAAGNGGKLTAQVSSDGDHLVFADTTTGGATTTVADLNNSHAAEDLGLNGDFSSGTLTTRRLVAGLNSVLLSSLNGGAGVDTSSLVIQRQTAGGTTSETIDLSNVSSLQDIVDAINNHLDGSSQADFHAEVSTGGTGLIIKDINGGQITGVSGATATSLHLSVNQDGAVDGGDLQRRYISENTLLANLNGGRGVAQSGFRITGTDGRSAEVTLTSSDTTIGKVIADINATNIGITASINATGDGILLTDTNGGAGKLLVAENGGTTAADLGILSTGTGATVDGSFAKTIQIGGGDTLDALVAKINAAKAGVTASVINDGSAAAPYRLVLTSNTSGAGGRINFSAGSTGLSFDTLSEAQDAKVVIGDPSSAGSVVITSGSNTVKNVVDGLTLNLKNVSDGPVSVTVAPDIDTIVKSVSMFIDTINSGFDKITELTKYDPDTQTAGLLLGDAAVRQVEDRLLTAINGTVAGQGLKFTNLTQIGITVGDGGHLKLDEDKFRQVFADDPEAITKLFTLTTTDDKGKVKSLGFGGKLADVIDSLTQAGTGLLTEQADQTQDKIDLYNQRAADMQKMLDAKQARLTRQFNAMESALASLQGQQSALAALAGAVSFAGSTSSLSSLSSAG